MYGHDDSRAVLLTGGGPLRFTIGIPGGIPIVGGGLIDLGGGGGLRPCEAYAVRAAGAARSASDAAVDRAWNAIGSAKAQGFTSLPDASAWASESSTGLEVTSGFNREAFDAALRARGITTGDAATALRAAGIEVDSGCAVGPVEVAKILLQRHAASAGTDGNVGGGGDGGSSPGGISPMMLLGIGAAAFFLARR